MALTDTQTMDLFHCLEIPYSTSYAAVDGMGAAYVQTANQPILSAAKDVILAFVAALEAKSLTDLGDLLTEYHSVRTIQFQMIGGSVGSFAGINFSAAEYRDNIKRRVQENVPYLRYHEILQRQEGGGAGVGMSGVCAR